MRRRRIAATRLESSAPPPFPIGQVERRALPRPVRTPSRNRNRAGRLEVERNRRVRGRRLRLWRHSSPRRNQRVSPLTNRGAPRNGTTPPRRARASDTSRSSPSGPGPTPRRQGFGQAIGSRESATSRSGDRATWVESCSSRAMSPCTGWTARASPGRFPTCLGPCAACSFTRRSRSFESEPLRRVGSASLDDRLASKARDHLEERSPMIPTSPAGLIAV